MDKILDIKYIVDTNLNACQISILDDVHKIADEQQATHDQRIKMINQAHALYLNMLKQPSIPVHNLNNAQQACSDAYDYYINKGMIYSYSDDDIHRIHALLGYISKLENELSLFE